MLVPYWIWTSRWEGERWDMNDGNNQSEVDVWVNYPTKTGYFIYSFLVPFINLFGICGNAIVLLVLRRKGFRASIYTYLTVLAVTDLVDSVLILFSSLCRGILWGVPELADYEAIIILPLGGFFSTLSVMCTVGVAFDRICFLWDPSRVCKPKFCKRRIARRIMLAGMVLAFIVNIPYALIYEWSDDEKHCLVFSDFYFSEFYAIFTWAKFAIFGILPAVFLTIGNSFLIYTIHKAHRMRKKCRTKCNIVCKKDVPAKDQTLVTVTLITIVFFFIIAEIPNQIASRRSATVILFNGDQIAASQSKRLEVFRQVVAVLSSVSISINFFIYSYFSPVFRQRLHDMCCVCCWRDEIKTNFSIFVLGEMNCRNGSSSSEDDSSIDNSDEK